MNEAADRAQAGRFLVTLSERAVVLRGGAPDAVLPPDARSELQHVEWLAQRIRHRYPDLDDDMS